MNLQLNNLTTARVAPANATAAPVATASTDAVPNPRGGKIDFAQLLAKVLPAGAVQKMALDADLAVDAKDVKKIADTGKSKSNLNEELPAPFAQSDKTDSMVLAADAKAETVAGKNVEPAATDANAMLDAMTTPPALAALLPKDSPLVRRPTKELEAATLSSAQRSTAVANSAVSSLPAATEDATSGAAKSPPQTTTGFVSNVEKELPQSAAFAQSADMSIKPLEAATSALASISANHSSPSSAARMEIAAPLQSLNWDQQLGQRVVWMSNQHQQSAEIRINPPELGPIELRLTLDAAQSTQSATLHFTSAHAEVREVIENAMPRLREMMAEAGISLGNATVSSESFRQQSPGQEMIAAKNPSTANSLPVDAIETTAREQKRGNALLDTFA